jgi:hypothetical protein
MHDAGFEWDAVSAPDLGRSIGARVMALQPAVIRMVRVELAGVARNTADEIAGQICVSAARRLVGSLEPAVVAIMTEYRRRLAAFPRTTAPGGPLDGLPEDERAVLLLRVIGGLDAATTATALGLSEHAVLLRQHHALARLRQRSVSRPAG